ncbi:hypothetical protein CC117_22485 [Parafrankia colletiae]|uniref:Uncharacterized protein n=1 Tax=Parafrankia colletiae TaxID=573497 RepID=A0A1S1QF73_9ACTN|nr:hypothetical protein [Parafrankia colletiae]MCK9901524.1 hypothetical protein [Frankia sp. Cpl3]OHV33443.1 hypothetical protein CC117_22485 [Parafrankia colletiae]
MTVRVASAVRRRCRCRCVRSPARPADVIRPRSLRNFFGAIDVDIEGELAQLGLTGYRPLRVRNTLF